MNGLDEDDYDDEDGMGSNAGSPKGRFTFLSALRDRVRQMESQVNAVDSPTGRRAAEEDDDDDDDIDIEDDDDDYEERAMSTTPLARGL